MTQTKKPRPVLELDCTLENSVLGHELEASAKQGAIKSLTVTEAVGGYYVQVELNWALNKTWYLTTRRDRTTPKIHKDLARLNDQLRELNPELGFCLERKLIAKKKKPKKAK